MAPELGFLLTFGDRILETQWRTAFNAAWSFLDVFWTIGVTIVAGIIWSRAWDASNPFLVFLYCTTLYGITAATIWLYFFHFKFYIAHRIPLVVAFRILRDLAIFHLFLGSQNTIWPSVEDTHSLPCHLLLYSTQSNKLYFIISRLLAYPVPLCIQMWTLSANIIGIFPYVAARCATDISAKSQLATCALRWSPYIDDVLGKGWVFGNPQLYGLYGTTGSTSMTTSSNSTDGTVLEAVKACTHVHMLLIMGLGGLLPLLVSATLEESWRLEWLYWRGGSPLQCSRMNRFSYDLALLAFGMMIAHQVILLAVDSYFAHHSEFFASHLVVG